MVPVFMRLSISLEFEINIPVYRNRTLFLHCAIQMGANIVKCSPVSVRGTTNRPTTPSCRRQTKWGDTFAVCCDPWRWRTRSWWL